MSEHKSKAPFLNSCNTNILALYKCLPVLTRFAALVLQLKGKICGALPVSWQLCLDKQGSVEKKRRTTSPKVLTARAAFPRFSPLFSDILP